MKSRIVVLSFLFSFGCSSQTIDPSRPQTSQAINSPYKSCPYDPQKQMLRSNELQELVKADQADRQLPLAQINWNIVAAADEVRAKRVAEIFAEGCFKSAKDFAAAALVFQHGVVPEHYYQAFLWSKKALDMGDETQKLMVANTVDRYLINLGYKQLFGAQSFLNSPNGCLCLGPTEADFPDKLRVKICGLSLKDRISTLHENNKANPTCKKVLYCDKKLTSAPKGIFPGIW